MIGAPSVKPADDTQKTFPKERWPLHFALAWALTRNSEFCEKAAPADYAPRRDQGGWHSAAEEDVAWNAMFSALLGGRAVAYGRPLSSPDVETARIPLKDLEKLDWRLHNGDPCLLAVADGRKRQVGALGYYNVEISSHAMIVEFAADGEPISFTTKNIGPPRNFSDPGYAPLSDAAYWIATEGGSKSFAARETEIWRGACAKLLAEIIDGSIATIGRQNGKGTPIRIDGIKFSGVPLDLPYASPSFEMIMNDVPHLRFSAPNLGSAWEGDFNDALFAGGRHGPEYTHIEVKNADVLQKWPFQIQKAAVKMTRAIARDIVVRYLEQAKARNDTPSQSGALSFAEGEGHRGHRDPVKEQYKLLSPAPVTRGRPKSKGNRSA